MATAMAMATATASRSPRAVICLDQTPNQPRVPEAPEGNDTAQRNAHVCHVEYITAGMVPQRPVAQVRLSGPASVGVGVAHCGV
jgi:hypothetical protein